MSRSGGTCADRFRRRRTDERGAAAVLMGVGLTLVLVAIAAFSVDLGMQRASRRDMQALADVVALDLARRLDGRTVTALAATMDTEMAKSVARNGDTLGDAPTLDWDLGKMVDGSFVELSGSAVPSAVRVNARTDVDFAFGGVTGVAQGGAGRTAVARAETGACFAVGSYAARINLGDGTILGPLLQALGTNVGLSVLDAQGLAGADIQLLDLVDTGLVAGGFDELVGADVTVGQFYLAVADVLENQGGHGAQVALLRQLATVAVKDVVINVADVVGVDSTNSVGLDAVVNVFDLVSTAAFVANGQNAISVPNLNVNVVGLSTLTASVKIGQKPIGYCGRAKAVRGETSQVEVNLSGNLLNLNLGLASISAPIALTLKLAPAAVDLDAVACLPASKRLEFLVTSGLVSLEITIGNPANRNNLAVKVLGLTVVDGYLRLYSSPAVGQSESGNVTVADDDYDGTPPAEFGSDNLGIPNLNQDTHLNVLGILPVGGLLGVVISPLLSIVVNPLVQTLDAALLSPLLGALGINIAGADVYALRKADCGIPELVG